MSRVVADLVDVRSNDFREAVVLLQVDRQISSDLTANFHQSFSILAAVDRNPHHVRSCVHKVPNLTHSGINVLSPRGGHALHGDGVPAADGNTSNRYASSRIADDFRTHCCAHGFDIHGKGGGDSR
jgi:hypothetical protein